MLNLVRYLDIVFGKKQCLNFCRYHVSFSSLYSSSAENYTKCSNILLDYDIVLASLSKGEIQANIEKHEQII